MEELNYRSWNDFNQSEDRRVGTFQLSIDDLARDLYYENRPFKDDDEEEEELNFDY
ncbi:MAG: hypothetical protein GY854_02730 [Deltaproteobacteria bacterium]|nr:hypothetical protein [Deltaproteobacteria bacterium]